MFFVPTILYIWLFKGLIFVVKNSLPLSQPILSGRALRELLEQLRERWSPGAAAAQKGPPGGSRFVHKIRFHEMCSMKQI